MNDATFALALICLLVANFAWLGWLWSLERTPDDQ